MTDDTLSDEDKDLFRSHMRHVKPLHEQPAKKFTPIQHKHEVKKTIQPKEEQAIPPLSDYIAEPVGAETILSFSLPTFPAQRMQDLKRGQIPWERVLDLHGMTKDEAVHALCDFIQGERHRRCVLVIHGKGSHSGEAPILKNLVHRWLPQLEAVQAYHSAQPKDGGTGAVYVLFKK